MICEFGSIRAWLALLLVEMFVSEYSANNRIDSSKDSSVDRSGSETDCGPGDPKECIEVSFACPNGDRSHFTCVIWPGPLDFNCEESVKFDCAPSETFTCASDYTCQSLIKFQCDAEIFRCNSRDPMEGLPAGKFECQHDQNDFDCVSETAYDFICDSQGDMSYGTQGFSCADIDPMFECDRLHVFRCESIFGCPQSHTCHPPRTDCPHPPEGEWGPRSGEDDDGTAGDFDCYNFTCDGDAQHRFDCQAGSQFKCLDHYDGNFHCGTNANFECGEEHEGFVCHDYNCANAFHCTEAFICGDLTGTLPFQCSGTTPETAFSCLAIPMPLPGWLTYDCGGGPSWEHCFKCHDTPWPTESFKCPAFNCNGVFHP